MNTDTALQQNLRIGVIGTGGMGGRHVQNLARRTAGAEVSAVMDVDMTRAAQIASQCGDAEVYNDATLLIADPNVDAIVIAAPDPTHAEIAIACIKAGKPTLCEKPLATNLPDARRVMDAEVTSGRRLIQLGFMREYDPAHRQIKDTVESGALGRPLYFRGTHTNLSEGERTVEEVIVNSAIHDIHSAHWLFGRDVTNVFARYIPVTTARPDSCRFALIELLFADGALALIELNADAGYGYEVRVEVIGEQGSASVNGLQEMRLRLDGRRAQVVEPEWLSRFDRAYVNEVRAWVQSVRSDQPAGPSTWDGYWSMVVADACIASARSGRPEAVAEMEQPALYR